MRATSMFQETLKTEIVSSVLWQRWPDHAVLGSFREQLGIFKQLCHTLPPASNGSSRTDGDPFECLCRKLAQAWRQRRANAPQDITPESRAAEIHVGPRKRQGPPAYRELQRMASVLSMLMHLSACTKYPGQLRNHRRPQKSFSSYPTSPAVSRLLAGFVLTHLVKEPMPARCCDMADAERFAKRALSFRLLDPSMETGQLLLQVACSLVQLVHRSHHPGSSAACCLTRAVLERLCSKCLWGIDRNPRAIAAVNTIFALLAFELGLPRLEIQNLFTADSITSLDTGRFGQFDGLLNNPPWGESMTRVERQALRRLSTTEHIADTYIAFSELAVRVLRPGGVYALVLPSQSLAARNACRLRELLLKAGTLDHLILLPRAAFADATVRGVALLGRVHPDQPAVEPIRVAIYPRVKRINDRGIVKSFRLPQGVLSQLGRRPWTKAFVEPSRDFSPVSTIMLGDLATVLSGVKMYHVGRGTPPQTRRVVRARPFSSSTRQPGTVPAVRGRHVVDFRLKPPDEFVSLGPWLAEVGQHSALRYTERVFVRELCRRDGKLNATIAPRGVLPLHGVLTVVPKMISALLLVALLNSRAVARYVQQCTASFSKVDFQRITVGELKELPVPLAAVHGRYRRRFRHEDPGERERELRRMMTVLARRLVTVEPRGDLRYDKLRERVEHVVSAMYGVSQA